MSGGPFGRMRIPECACFPVSFCLFGYNWRVAEAQASDARCRFVRDVRRRSCPISRSLLFTTRTLSKHGMTGYASNKTVENALAAAAGDGFAKGNRKHNRARPRARAPLPSNNNICHSRKLSGPITFKPLSLALSLSLVFLGPRSGAPEGGAATGESALGSVRERGNRAR